MNVIKIEPIVRQVIETDNDWKILKQLGKGSYGVVYLAEKKGIQKAIKVIMYEGKRPDLQADIEKEIKIMHHLAIKGKCDLIPCVREVYYADDDPSEEEDYFSDSKSKTTYYTFLVMDYIQGIPLKTYWNNLDNPELKVKLIYLVVLALRTLHYYNILHLDVHGENIMVTDDLHIYFIDFGLACMKDKCWAPFGGLYSPPEHDNYRVGNENKQVFSEMSDVYQLGLILSEMIRGETIQPVIYSHNCVSEMDVVINSLRTFKEYSPWNIIIGQMIKCDLMERPNLDMVIEEYKTGKMFSSKYISSYNKKHLKLYKSRESSEILTSISDNKEPGFDVSKMSDEKDLYETYEDGENSEEEYEGESSSTTSDEDINNSSEIQSLSDTDEDT